MPTFVWLRCRQFFVVCFTLSCVVLSYHGYIVFFVTILFFTNKTISNTLPLISGPSTAKSLGLLVDGARPSQHGFSFIRTTLLDACWLLETFGLFCAVLANDFFIYCFILFSFVVLVIFQLPIVHQSKHTPLSTQVTTRGIQLFEGTPRYSAWYFTKIQ